MFYKTFLLISIADIKHFTNFDGEVFAMPIKANIKDVARQAGVSISLVSKVLNAPKRADGSPDCGVRKETAARIFDAVDRLGYRPNRAAASLRRGSKSRIGVIIPDISNCFFADMARGIENIAYDEGYTVLFGSSDENPRKLGELADFFVSDGVDGLIITPCCDCEEHIRRTIKSGTPVVLTTRDIPEINGVGRVIPDSVKGVSLALDHLMQCGYSRVEMVSLDLRFSNITDRERLYTEYMAAKDLPSRIHHCSHRHKEQDAFFILEDVVRRGVQALFFPSATLPLIFLHECVRQGIRVPEQIALIGFDGGDTFSITNPPLSQVYYPREESAQEPFKMLQAIIEAGTVPPAVVLEPALEVAASTCGSRPAASTCGSRSAEASGVNRAGTAAEEERTALIAASLQQARRAIDEAMALASDGFAASAADAYPSVQPASASESVQSAGAATPGRD